MAAHADIALEKGLPANQDAERFVLGAILMDDALYIQVAGTLEADDFSLEKHRRIFLRMGDLYERGERIDRVTVANELMKQNQLESVDGVTYLVSLQERLKVRRAEGVPPRLETWVQRYKECVHE